MERVFVYIDGSNLYRNLKQINCASMNFNFRAFINHFVVNKKLMGIRYYIGQIIPNDNILKSLELHKHQQILFEKLQKQGIYVVRGRIRQLGNIFTEKGVDVRIGIDLVEGAYENRFDTALVVSSDGDLAPALEMVVRKNKTVEVVGFKHKPSYALIQKANIYHSVDKNMVEKFCNFFV
jgi:uncharacterized LabA/DUF88 family protein